MADGTSSEIPKPNPIEAQSSIWERLKAKFGKKARKNTRPVRITGNPAQYAEFMETFPGLEFDLGAILSRQLKEKGLPRPPYKSLGASGFESTNERIKYERLKEIKDSPNAPDGYIVGVGVQNIFSLLELFPDGVDPKGLILINIDPSVMVYVNEFIAGLKKGIVKYGPQESAKYNPEKVRYWDEGVLKANPYNDGSKTVYTKAVMVQKAEQLIRMAKAGKITAVQQDILDPTLLEAIGSLPGFKTSRNVIYLSNIADWIYRVGIAGDEGIFMKFFAYRRKHPEAAKLPYEEVSKHWQALYGKFHNLEKLQPAPPNMNYYADTSDRFPEEERYSLRIRTEYPKFDGFSDLI